MSNCIAFPSTTTRSFSKDCGMSEGYFASTQSQLLPLSTKALTNLANTMDMRANIVAHTDRNNHKGKTTCTKYQANACRRNSS